jgi:zinc protease
MISVWMAIALLPGASAAGVFPYQVQSRTLDNGLVVHVVPMPSAGVVAYATWMSVGSRDEVDVGRTGFAHFFEHLMFYGTETMPPEVRSREMLRMGADANAWTWFDETVYHAVLSKEALPRLIELEADRFQHLKLTPEDVRRQAGAVYGEYRKAEADPSQRVTETLYGTAFTAHTYRHDTIGYEADIAAMTTAHEYAAAFFDRFYRPEHATVLIVGDVEPEPVFAEVEAAYGTWARASLPRPMLPIEPVQTEDRRSHVAWPSATAPLLAMGWHTPAASPDDPRAAALTLAADLLGSPVGPLYHRLVEEEGIAYEVTVRQDALVDPGLFTVSVVVKEPAHLARAEAVVREEVGRLTAPVEAATLDRARSHSRYAFQSGLDDPRAVLDALGEAMRRAGPAASGNPIDRFYATYDAVTPQTMADAVSLFLTQPVTVVTLAPDVVTGGEP